MTILIPLAAMVALLVGWALWQRHRDPWMLVRRSPEWVAVTEATERVTVEIGVNILPAMRSLAEAAEATGRLMAQLNAQLEANEA